MMTTYKKLNLEVGPNEFEEYLEITQEVTKRVKKKQLESMRDDAIALLAELENCE